MHPPAGSHSATNCQEMQIQNHLRAAVYTPSHLTESQAVDTSGPGRGGEAEAQSPSLSTGRQPGGPALPGTGLHTSSAKARAEMPVQVPSVAGAVTVSRSQMFLQRSQAPHGEQNLHAEQGEAQALEDDLCSEPGRFRRFTRARLAQLGAASVRIAENLVWLLWLPQAQHDRG